MCAASPSSTTFSCRQVWHRTVVNVVQRELLANRLVPVEHVGAQVADALDRGLVALARRQPRGLGESGPPPDVLVHLQDEGAGPVAVRVAVYLHDPGRGVQDVELERVEHQVRAQPDVLAPPSFQIWAERSGVRAPGQRIRSVGGDHQVVIRRQGRYVRCLGAEQDPYAELRAAGLQDGQQPLAAHRREAVPARGESRRPPKCTSMSSQRANSRRMAVRRSRRRHARCRPGSRRRTPRRNRTCRRRRCAPRP